MAGLHVDLACANPANHGLVGRVLSAVSARAGGSLRCFWQAIAHGTDAGPQIMAGPTGPGPSQIQSADKLAGLQAGGRAVAIVDNMCRSGSYLCTVGPARTGGPHVSLVCCR